jgi:hypothetical protein
MPALKMSQIKTSLQTWLVSSFITGLQLFFILGHVSGGRVTVTDGKLQDIFTIMNMSLLNG